MFISFSPALQPVPRGRIFSSLPAFPYYKVATSILLASSCSRVCLLRLETKEGDLLERGICGFFFFNFTSQTNCFQNRLFQPYSHQLQYYFKQTFLPQRRIHLEKCTHTHGSVQIDESSKSARTGIREQNGPIPQKTPYCALSSKQRPHTRAPTVLTSNGTN